jgi:hypothetical protein
MILSDDTISHFLSERHDEWQSCSEYGEPGYQDSRTTLVVLGDYWCRCPKFQPDDPRPLHGLSDHHPRFWRQLEDQGVQFEWYDEWTIDYEAATLPRPPAWITTCGFEWLYRLLREPRQRWHRYLVHQPPVLWHLLLQRLGVYRNPFASR